MPKQIQLIEEYSKENLISFNKKFIEHEGTLRYLWRLPVIDGVKWVVMPDISMEFLHSFLRHHFMRKPPLMFSQANFLYI